MQDEEYPAYLRKQSYENFVSISYSIDKEVVTRRYEMVLAEIAERDKRGEKIPPITKPEIPILLSIAISLVLLACSLALG